MGKRRASRDETLSPWQAENPLRLWRLKQGPEGWNRSVLARQLKVSPTAVRSWERGERVPKVDVFAKIESMTGITSVQWMGWFQKKPKGK
jgi:ribosome-binding protein aMBF1 (putative translation factor)